MKPRFIDRVDDLLNPIVVKELRQAVQSRIVIAVLLLFLLIEVTTLGIFVMFHQPAAGPGNVDFHAGVTIFMWLESFLLITCMIAIPIYGGVRLAAERSDTNVDLLFISTLRPRSIVWGKFVSAVVLILLIFCTCAPFMMFTYLLRGIDLPTILLVLGMDFLAVLLGTQGALFAAAVPASRPVRILIGAFAVLALLMLLWTSVMGAIGMVELGLGSAMDSGRFWGPASGVLALFVGAIGLLFTWSIAVVSPPSANRAVAARLFLLLYWLATFVGTLVWMRQLKEHYPMVTWMYISAALWGLQLVISMNEREQWGSRVRRLIPGRLVLRLPAFLLYSGSGGGVVLSLIMLALTVLVGRMSLELNPVAASLDETGYLAVLVTLILYLAAYSLSAILLRRLAGNQRVPPLYTWIIGLVLMALGTVVPYLVYWSVASAMEIYGNPEIEWVISNPFAAASEAWDLAKKPGFSWFNSAPILFPSVWSALALLASVPWLVRQLQDFRPPDPAPYAMLADGNGEAAAAYLPTTTLGQESS